MEEDKRTDQRQNQGQKKPHQAKDSKRREPSSFAQDLRNKAKNRAIGMMNPMASFSTNKLRNQENANTTPSNGAPNNGLSNFFDRANKRRMNQQPNQKQVASDGSKENSTETTKEDGKSPSKSLGGALGDFAKRGLMGSVTDFARKSILSPDDDDAMGSSDENGVGQGFKSLFNGMQKIAGLMTGLMSLPAMLPLLLIGFVLALIFTITVNTTTVTTTVGTYAVDFLISEKWGETLTGIEVDESDLEPEQVSFVNRAISIATKYKDKNQTFDPHLISAVQFVINQYNEKFTYRKMTSGVMEELVELMFKDKVYDEATFRQNLIDSFFPKYADGVDEGLFSKMADLVFQYVKDYQELISDGKKQLASAGGSCTYVAPGVNIEGQQRNHPINATDIQVQLMESGTANGHDYGGTWGTKMAGEELVPFEKYVPGVANQEIGADSKDEAIKAQMVAARSYALARPVDMGGWRKLVQEGGQWILYAAGSTQDQVYCSMDKGCSSNKSTAASDACQWGMIYSGTTGHGTKCRDPLSEGHKLYALGEEMAGKVLVDKDGYIIYTNFAQGEQTTWLNSSGDYTQMLLSTYGSRGAVEVKQMACTASTAAGDYANWKQYDDKWGDIPLSPSSSTMRQIGCLVTSLSILVAKSGVATPGVDGTLDPGTFVKALSKVNSFTSGGALVSMEKATAVAPQFKYVGQQILSGSNDLKAKKIGEYLNQGYYIVAFVTNSETSSHFVALDSMGVGDVNIMDPGGEHTKLFETYNCSRIELFKKE